MTPALAVISVGLGCGASDGPTAGAGDAGSRDRRGGTTDLGMPDAGMADAAAMDLGSPGPGRFDDDWTEDEAVRMFLGLGEGSCGLYRANDGDELSAKVTRDPGLAMFNVPPSWDWTVSTADGVEVREENYSEPEGPTIRFNSRARGDGTTVFRLEYGFVLEPPIFVSVSPQRRPTSPSYVTNGVDTQESRMTNMGGSSVTVAGTDHVVSNEAGSFETPEGTFDGYRFVHFIDGVDVATYEVIPAFGITAFDQDGKTFRMCDYRVCSSTGCFGTASCDDLVCR